MKRLAIVVSVVAIMLVAAVAANVYAQMVGNAAVQQWYKYQDIEINVAADLVNADVEVLLNIPYQSGMLSDFSDLRFFTVDGKPLKHQVLSYSASQSASNPVHTF